MLSAVEKQRKKKGKDKEEQYNFDATEDMSGELQTIPARHGVATFVPRGRTIKVINTYGKQVVSMWAFTLGPPPEEGDDEEGEGKELDDEQVKKEAEQMKKAVEEEGEKPVAVGDVVALGQTLCAEASPRAGSRSPRCTWIVTTSSIRCSGSTPRCWPIGGMPTASPTSCTPSLHRYCSWVRTAPGC